MDQSLSSLAFEGSISEAIVEAKQQKKLFVVYTSEGENAESKLLETSTWSDPSVAESLRKYCILLHILEGSSDATNFSAIYPHNSVPCVTVIGYNGVRLWEKEGFVAADVLVSNLEKAWLSLHVQETTAAFLTAALASKNQHSTAASETASSEHDTNITSSSTDNQVQSLHAEQSSNSVQTDQSNSCKDDSQAQEIDPECGDKASHMPSSHTAVFGSRKLDDASATVEENKSSNPVEISSNNSEVDHPIPDKNVDAGDHHSEISKEVSLEISRKANEEAAHVDMKNTEEVEKADASNFSAVQSSDVFLNIRLADGSSLQVKFSMMDTLRMVKNHVNENQSNSFGAYNLAVPYPRKVFSDHDLDNTLSELGLTRRQALMVVPCKGTNLQYRGGSSSANQTNSSNSNGSSNGSNQGYWALLKTALSYVNPLSYLGGGANSSGSAQESQSGVWQYSPNSSVGRVPSADQNTSRDTRRGTRSRPSGFGGNIHTLKHEDDSRFNDKNAFWNGNSTQYGGDNDGK